MWRKAVWLWLHAGKELNFCYVLGFCFMGLLFASTFSIFASLRHSLKSTYSYQFIGIQVQVTCVWWAHLKLSHLIIYYFCHLIANLTHNAKPIHFILYYQSLCHAYFNYFIHCLQICQDFCPLIQKFALLSIVQIYNFSALLHPPFLAVPHLFRIFFSALTRPQHC